MVRWFPKSQLGRMVHRLKLLSNKAANCLVTRSGLTHSLTACDWVARQEDQDPCYLQTIPFLHRLAFRPNPTVTEHPWTENVWFLKCKHLLVQKQILLFFFKAVLIRLLLIALMYVKYKLYWKEREKIDLGWWKTLGFSWTSVDWAIVTYFYLLRVPLSSHGLASFVFLFPHSSCYTCKSWLCSGWFLKRLNLSMRQYFYIHYEK